MLPNLAHTFSVYVSPVNEKKFFHCLKSAERKVSKFCKSSSNLIGHAFFGFHFGANFRVYILTVVLFLRVREIVVQVAALTDASLVINVFLLMLVRLCLKVSMIDQTLVKSLLFYVHHNVSKHHRSFDMESLFYKATDSYFRNRILHTKYDRQQFILLSLLVLVSLTTMNRKVT